MCLIKVCSHCGVKIEQNTCLRAHLTGFCPQAAHNLLVRAQFCAYCTPQPAENFSRSELRSIALILVSGLDDISHERSDIESPLQEGSHYRLDYSDHDISPLDLDDSVTEPQTFDELFPGEEPHTSFLDPEASLPEPQTFDEDFPNGETLANEQQLDIGEIRLDSLETDESSSSERVPQPFDYLFPGSELHTSIADLEVSLLDPHTFDELFPNGEPDFG